jgi:hypothetical protein
LVKVEVKKVKETVATILLYFIHTIHWVFNTSNGEKVPFTSERYDLLSHPRIGLKLVEFLLFLKGRPYSYSAKPKNNNR